MSQLTSVTAAGKGLVGVILPDTTTSARYTSYDLPYLTQAFTAAGYEPTRLQDRQRRRAPPRPSWRSPRPTSRRVPRSCSSTRIDSPTGKQIQTAAAAAGVTMISYDRATFQGTNTYYVSFDNVQVGELIGQGFMQCVTDWARHQPAGLHR